MTPFARIEVDKAGVGGAARAQPFNKSLPTRRGFERKPDKIRSEPRQDQEQRSERLQRPVERLVALPLGLRPREAAAQVGKQSFGVGEAEERRA